MLYLITVVIEALSLLYSRHGRPSYIGGYPYTTRPKLRDHWTFRALALLLHASSSALRYIKSDTRFEFEYVNSSRKRQTQAQTRCLPYDVTDVDLSEYGQIELDRKDSRNSMTLAEAPENAACTDPETCRTCSSRLLKWRWNLRTFYL